MAFQVPYCGSTIHSWLLLISFGGHCSYYSCVLLCRNLNISCLHKQTLFFLLDQNCISCSSPVHDNLFPCSIFKIKTIDCCLTLEAFSLSRRVIISYLNCPVIYSDPYIKSKTSAFIYVILFPIISWISAIIYLEVRNNT